MAERWDDEGEVVEGIDGSNPGGAPFFVAFWFFSFLCRCSRVRYSVTTIYLLVKLWVFLWLFEVW